MYIYIWLYYKVIPVYNAQHMPIMKHGSRRGVKNLAFDTLPLEEVVKAFKDNKDGDGYPAVNGGSDSEPGVFIYPIYSLLWVYQPSDSSMA